MRIYNTSEYASPTTSAILRHGAPALDAAFQDAQGSTVFSGGLDETVRCFDVATSQQTAVLGKHEGIVRCIEWLSEKGLVASGAWDKTMRLWDPRASDGGVSTIALPGKAYSMSVSTSSRIVVATSGRSIVVFDVRALGSASVEPEQLRESSLKHQTRCVRCFPDGSGFAISSIEGRVGMEFFDPSEDVQTRKYAFKCHRRVEDDKDMIYPVNALAFNAKYGTFATGGGDGVVNIWDGEHKKRICQISGYATSISALAFNAQADMLAIAESYTWEQGEKANPPPDAIYLRHLSEKEVMPRVMQQ